MWKEKIKERVRNEAFDDMATFARYALNAKNLAQKVCELIEILETQPSYIVFGAISNDITIGFKDSKPVHELARKLRLKFVKTPTEVSPKVAYTAKWDGVSLKIKVSSVPKCRFIKKEETRTETFYELVCE